MHEMQREKQGADRQNALQVQEVQQQEIKAEEEGKEEGSVNFLLPLFFRFPENLFYFLPLATSEAALRIAALNTAVSAETLPNPARAEAIFIMKRLTAK